MHHPNLQLAASPASCVHALERHIPAEVLGGRSYSEVVATEAESDRLIAAFMSGEPGAEVALSAADETTLHRMLALRDGGTPLPPSLRGMNGRAALDYWNQALAIVARANPAPFLDHVVAHPPMRPWEKTLVAAILGDLDDDQAVGLLCASAADEDYFVRMAAVSSLGRRSEPAVLPCLERALQDPDAPVYLQAVRGISRWNAERAVTLYEHALRSLELTPLCQQIAEAALHDLSEGRPVRKY